MASSSLNEAGTGFYAIILAAGRGKRMRDESLPDEFPKVLRTVLGRPMVSWVADAVRDAGISDISVIVGLGADQVSRTLGDGHSYIVQGEQHGSGHAVACAAESLDSRGGHALVLCGDSPLFTTGTIRSLMETHVESGAAASLTSAVLRDPTGYGRIKRAANGQIVGVVEQKCATPEERAIREINGGAYAFDSDWLWDSIGSMRRNEAGELNLTDMVRIAVSQGKPVASIRVLPDEIQGVNTPDELIRVEAVLRRRIAAG